MTKRNKLSTTVLCLLLLFIAVAYGLHFAKQTARQLAVNFVANNTPWQLQLPEKTQWSISNPGAITFVGAGLTDDKKTLLGLGQLTINLNLKALMNNHLSVQRIDAQINQLAISQEQLTALQTMPKSQEPQPQNTQPSWLQKLTIDHINIDVKNLSFKQQSLVIAANNGQFTVDDIALDFQQEDIISQLALSAEVAIKQLSVNDSQFTAIQLLAAFKQQKLDAQFQVQWQQQQLKTQATASFNEALSINIKSLELQIKEFNEQQLQELQQLQASLQTSDKNNNSAEPEEGKQLLQNLSIEKLLVTAKSISLKEQALQLSDLAIEANNMPLLKEQHWVHNSRELANFTASISLGEGLYAKQHITNLSIAIAHKDQSLLLEHLTAVLDNGEVAIQGSADLSKKELPSAWQGSLNNINLQMITAESAFPSTGIINAGFTANISNSLDTENLIDNMQASVFAKGEDLQISNIDIDKLVSTIRSAREISWTDIGAIGFFGPIGLLYSTAASVGTGTIKPGQGTSHISQVDINATSDGPWVTFHDNIIVTKKNKISFRGQINHQSEAFKDFEIAFLNNRYCATFLQNITGTYRNPKISLSNLSAGFILSTAGDLLTLKPLREQFCKPYYQGELNTL